MGLNKFDPFNISATYLVVSSLRLHSVRLLRLVRAVTEGPGAHAVHLDVRRPGSLALALWVLRFGSKVDVKADFTNID